MAALRARLTFANVMSVAAVFIALGGSAIAINKIKANSVGTKQIKANGVKNTDIANDAVTSPKVANGSLEEADFAAGQIPRGATGPQGPQGPTGTVDTSNFYDKSASDARFLGIGATAANSSALGGTPAAVVPRSVRDNNQGPDGATKLGFARRTLPPDSAVVATLLNVPNVGSIEVACQNPPQTGAQFRNTQGVTEDLWLQELTSSSNGFFRETVAPGAVSTTLLGSGATDGVNRYQVIVGAGDSAAGGARIAVFDIVMVSKPNGANSCTFQTQSQSFTN